jgi:hypothetical protein
LFWQVEVGMLALFNLSKEDYRDGQMVSEERVTD